MIFHRIKEYICVCVCVCVCVYIYIYIYIYVSKSWHHRLNGQKFEQIAGARKGIWRRGRVVLGKTWRV